jgi:heat shock protein HslJ
MGGAIMNIRLLGTITLLLALGAGGCATMQGPAPDAAHSSRNALDWAGTYKGVLPCADCEGIETTVTLRADGSYSKRMRYLGREVEPLVSDGRFTWNEAGTIISLSGKTPAKYRVGEGRLTQLALDGSAITGAIADHFVLTKMDDRIIGKHWKLVELRGKPVPKLGKEPYFILQAKDNRITGFGGCNGFSGTYTLDTVKSRIHFSQLISTMMACTPGMDVERAFTDVLAQADNYSLDGDRLSLNRARMAPLARFEAVYLQ